MSRSKTSRGGATQLSNEQGETWAAVCTNLGELGAARTSTALAVAETNRTRQKLISVGEGNLVPVAQELFRSYETLHGKLRHELSTLSAIVESLTALQVLRGADDEDERRKRRRLEDPGSPSDAGTPTPPGGSGPYIPIPVGAQVAVQPLGHEWLLATVMVYKPGDKPKYEVEDIDGDDTGQKKRYIFPAKSVYEVNNSGTELPANSIVLALYPNTTCFYQAKVHTVPSKQGNGQYLVQFEEDDNQLREVERKYVLPLPTKQSKLRSSEKK